MGFEAVGVRYARGNIVVLAAICLLATVRRSRALSPEKAERRSGGRGDEIAYESDWSVGEESPSRLNGTTDLDRIARLSAKRRWQQLPQSLFNNTAPHVFRGQLPKFVNSASEHGEEPNALDWIMVSVCVAVPLLICGIFRVWEGMGASSEHIHEARQGRRPRIGSLYRLLDQSSSKMTPVSMLMQVFDSDQAEGTLSQNVVAGFTTALAMIPNVVSFSFVTETPPANGLWACAFMSISTSLFGGRPGTVSGVSAGTATVLANISTTYTAGGMAPMALCVFGAGVMQIFLGSLRVSRLMTLIPHPVMIGFVNGLALVMLRAQLRYFHEYGDGKWVSYGTSVGMMVAVGVSMSVAMAWGKVPVGGKAIPAALASLVITTLFSFVVPTTTVGDVAGPGMLEVGFGKIPKWDFPPVGMDWDNHGLILQTLTLSFRLSLVCLLESLMTEALVDQITGTVGSMRRECFGQGVGNILASLFGTQGGCALLGHSLLNVSSGGKGRLSSVTAGFTLILCATVLAPLVEIIPAAGVMGVLILIALNTFAWGTFKLILRVNWIDSVVVIIVMLITLWYDIAVAVLVGVIVNGIGFAWTIATEARVETEAGADTRTFYPIGPLFFGSAKSFQNEMSPQMITESRVVLDFSKCRILDMSGVNAINQMRDLLISQKKQVFLKGVPRDVFPFLPKDAEFEALRPKEAVLQA
jgi:SulP family sulfate permease